ncbi:hypothetical protein ACFV4N_14300 [Actinosynnema sp. NPDC059797]
MSQPSESAIERIRAVFDRAVRDGLRRDSVRGASDEEIDRMAAEQGVDRVPEAVREVLRLVGSRPGLWLAGTAFGVDAVTGERKRHAIAALGHFDHGPADPGGLLVLTAHQGYAYQVVDGADLDQDDPPVWNVVEGEEAARAWDSVSRWFASTAPDVAELRDVLEVMEEMGKTLPAWARDVEPRAEG